jgi:hypothetical protein
VTLSTIPVRSPLDGFAGVITRSRPSVPYQLGLAVVAFLMVLLPAAYVGLILLVGWGSEPAARGSRWCSTSARSPWGSS